MAHTFRKLIGAKYTVTAYCDAQYCHHYQTLDLEALGERLGMDAEAMASDLIPKLRCAKCGSRKVSLTYTPPTGPLKYMG